MQDNGNQNMFDKKFVDASWVDMKTLLDRDIPVPATPINKTIIALSTLLFISTITIAYLIYLQSVNIPTAELTKEHYIYKNIYLNENDNHKGLSFSSKVNIYSSVPFSKSISSQNILDSKHNLKDSDTENVILFSNNSNNTLKNKLINKLPQLNQLDLSLLNPISNTVNINSEKNQNPTENSINKNSIKYNLGLLSFVSSNTNFSGYGFTTGVHLPITKKIGIQTGLAVNFVSRDFLVLPFLPRNKQSLKSYSPLDEEETFYNGLKSFKQIYLPVNLSYSISNVFSINSGFKFRYTYSQDIDNVLESRASRSIPKNETVENAFFNNSNIGVSFGINYKVNKSLNLILDSEWGMNSLINKDQFKHPSSNPYDLNLINLTTRVSF